MTTDHLKPLLDHVENTHLFLLMGEQLARARVPFTIHASMRQGRIHFHSRSPGVASEGLSSRMSSAGWWHGWPSNSARQWVQRLHLASTPCPRGPGHNVWVTFFKCSQIDPLATIVSIDGVVAYDSISREAMLEALIAMPGGSETLPFVRSFCGQPSRYVWGDEFGVVH